jgi:hypothetical protein
VSLLLGTSTTKGCCSTQRSWNQCVAGRPGAVDSQRWLVEPLKSTSNQVARPCRVQGWAAGREKCGWCRYWTRGVMLECTWLSEGSWCGSGHGNIWTLRRHRHVIKTTFGGSTR